MKRLVITLITTCLLTCLQQAHGQDIHFSQFYASPLTLNPSLTGAHNSDFRIVDNYRSQWFTLNIPFVSNSVSVDFPIYTKKHHFAGGINAIYDASGDAKLRVSKIYSSFSVFLKPNGHIINIGIQPGYVTKNFDVGNATFPDQYNEVTGTFDPNLSTTGSFVSNEVSYPDLNIGVYWTKEFDKFIPELGIAVFHINEPDESFLSSSNKLDNRKIVHAGVRFNSSNLWKIMPKVIYLEQKKASQVVLGSNFQMNNPGNSRIEFIYFGGFIRSGYNRNVDAGILTIGAGMKELALGLSYDINVSSLRPATSYQGALEISIIYTKKNELSKKIAIPCERF